MNLVQINENINRLLANIWSIIVFFREYLVDPAKDVSMTFKNEDGSESVNIIPNINKQNEGLETWKDSQLLENKRDNPMLPNMLSNTKYWEGADGATPPTGWTVNAMSGSFTINFTRIPLIDADISKTGTVAHTFGVNNVQEMRDKNMIGAWNIESSPDTNYGTDHYALGIEITFADEEQPTDVYGNNYILLSQGCLRYIGWNSGNNTTWGSVFVNILEAPVDGLVNLFNNRSASVRMSLMGTTDGWISKTSAGLGFGGCGQFMYIKPIRNTTYKFAIALPYATTGDLGDLPLYAGSISKYPFTHDDNRGV